MGHCAGPRLFQDLYRPLRPHRRVHAQFSAKALAEEWDFTMKRIRRVEKLERRIERIFFGISMALLIFVLLCILIVARKSFGTERVNSGSAPAQSHG